MKKVILFMAVAVLSTVSASAQVEAGKKFLSAHATGFDFSSKSYKGGGDSELNFSLAAKGSYFVMDKIAITAGLSIAYANSPFAALAGGDEGDGGSGYSSGDTGGEASSDGITTFGFELGARYYITNTLYAGLSYGGDKAGEADLASHFKLEAGYDYYLTENVFFEPAVYFKSGLGDLSYSQFGLSIGIGVNF